MVASPGSSRVDWLVAAHPGLAAAVASDRANVEAALGAALDRGRAAWPQLAVDDEAFTRAVAGGVRETDAVAAAIEALHAEDLYLAQACASNAPAALAAFATLCDPALTTSLRQMGLADDAVDELLQEVRTKLFVGVNGPAKISTYSGRAALRSWTRTIATRAAVDRIRARAPASEDDDVLQFVPDSADDPELAHFRQTYHAEFKSAFEEALATLEVRERNLLRHYFVDQLTVEEIGALYSVHKATASRWIDAAREALSKRTRAGFQQRLKALPADIDSILRLLQSHIDLSLSRVLAS
ncbi:MAG: sigma-70 family RNA polymerase sigma factor [Kofleriaceae bacterium]